MSLLGRWGKRTWCPRSVRPTMRKSHFALLFDVDSMTGKGQRRSSCLRRYFSCFTLGLDVWAFGFLAQNEEGLQQVVSVFLKLCSKVSLEEEQDRLKQRLASALAEAETLRAEDLEAATARAMSIAVRCCGGKDARRCGKMYVCVCVQEVFWCALGFTNTALAMLLDRLWPFKTRTLPCCSASLKRQKRTSHSTGSRRR